MATYTFTEKVPSNMTNYAGVVNDGNHAAMNGAVGSGPQTQDATGTPVVSPVSVSNSAVTTINVPLNAISIYIMAITNTVNISEADATVATKYFTVPTSIPVSIDLGRTAVLYLKANTGASTVSFYFNVV